MSAAFILGRRVPVAAHRPARSSRGTWRGWARWAWTQLAAVGETRYRARMARGHWR